MSLQLCLASGSPRRRELLHQIGVPFSVQTAELDERARPDESPAEYVQRLALAKAAAVWQRLQDPSTVVLGADTAVVCDQHILGKPRDEQHACAMLRQLSGRCHQVMTAVALVCGDRQKQALNVTEVCFRQITEPELARYWASGEPADKAGGYGIQGLGAVFVEAINGSYSSVVGLPLYETAALLAEFDLPVWQQPGTAPDAGKPE